MKQSLWLSLTLIILTGSAWYYGQLKPVLPLDNETLSSTIDTRIAQLTVKRFNEQGELVSLLTTPLMEHIPKNNVHLLQLPHIVIKEKNQPDWEINSKHATSFAGGSHITFRDKVIMHQHVSNTHQESTLKTEKIIYYPQEKRATTDLFVTFEQPGNRVESTGMNAYMEEKRVELLHGAKGSYVPTHQG